ncbi:hypothetical protein EYF80_029914 [Liparis tanakae]|uniref:Uncharacterized protein n=1 Tax=Liparis tanakae TaxID=230148 RepID=A0A4Z2H3J0_9TELE|nr:hypothetical protein EYF80_029914 [Liparis tanakae]
MVSVESVQKIADHHINGIFCDVSAGYHHAGESALVGQLGGRKQQAGVTSLEEGPEYLCRSAAGLKEMNWIYFCLQVFPAISSQVPEDTNQTHCHNKAPVEVCTDYPPSSELSQHAVQKVLWSNELLRLQGQIRMQKLGATAPLKVLLLGLPPHVDYPRLLCTDEPA